MGLVVVQSIMPAASSSVLMRLMIVPGAMPTGLGVMDHGAHLRCATLCMVMSHVGARIGDLLHLTCRRRVSNVRVQLAHVARMVMATAATRNRIIILCHTVLPPLL